MPSEIAFPPIGETHARSPSFGGRTVDKALRVIDMYPARRGVLAANAIEKLENYRDKASREGKEAAN
ncbi:hypothetical protein ACE10Z_22015 [Bradyrhizobium sp. Pha-3]|uniref:hypothetical protein n=1 Tax=Bradyrhizobium sp. Pha-3 TaxID=208375 RepID=UPI0035D3EBC7